MNVLRNKRVYKKADRNDCVDRLHIMAYFNLIDEDN